MISLGGFFKVDLNVVIKWEIYCVYFENILWFSGGSSRWGENKCMVFDRFWLLLKRLWRFYYKKF